MLRDGRGALAYPGEFIGECPLHWMGLKFGKFPSLIALVLTLLALIRSPGQAGSQEFIYPLIAAVTGPILTFAPPAFFGAYSRNWPLPRLMARDPSPTLKMVFSPRRVIV